MLWIHSYFRNIWSTMSETGRQTIFKDISHRSLMGVNHTLTTTFYLLIAIKYFDSNEIVKSCIMSAQFFGLTFAFIYINLIQRFSKKLSVQAAIPNFMSAIMLLVAAWSEEQMSFSTCVITAAVSTSVTVPIHTSILRNNFKTAVRGQVFSITMMFNVACSISASFLFGQILDQDVENFRKIFLLCAVIEVIAGFVMLRIPNVAASQIQSKNPLANFKILKQDKAFLYVLITWFIFGFSNLSLQPQRIEYLVQEEYGFSYSPAQITIYVAVIPIATRFLFTLPMGWLFDRMNFIVMRIVLNVFFFVSTLLYFTANSPISLAVAGIFQGLGFSGGAVAWHLWVTKFAPKEDTTSYMALHTFFNGIRGMMGPFVGYMAAKSLGLPLLSQICAAGIALSILMFMPLINHGRLSSK